MKTNFAFAILVLALSGCGTDTNTNTVQQVPVPGPTVVVTATPDPAPTLSADEQVAADIKVIVDNENQYREGLGQTALTSGLSCTLYTITGGTYINATSITGASQSPVLSGVVQAATFLLTDGFNQADSPVTDGLNVLPTALRGLPQYQNLIKLTCQGQLVVTSTGFVSYDLTSDDASVLTVDGARLIDNDGGHGATLKSAQKYLRSGVHTFRLDFAQTGAGNQALILNANGSLLVGQYFYH